MRRRILRMQNENMKIKNDGENKHETNTDTLMVMTEVTRKERRAID